jgi:hypothetical protein
MFRGRPVRFQGKRKDELVSSHYFRHPEQPGEGGYLPDAAKVL